MKGVKMGKSWASRSHTSRAISSIILTVGDAEHITRLLSHLDLQKERSLSIWTVVHSENFEQIQML